MPGTVNRIRTSLAIRGPVGTLTHFARRGIMALSHFSPGVRTALAEAHERDQNFDREHGTDTCEIVSPDAKSVIGRHWKYGVKYQPVDPLTFEQCLQRLRLPWEEFTFIDIGSGKGRGVLLAADFPFRRVIGIEYCEELNDIARKNLRRWPEARRRCNAIDILCLDATGFAFPDGPLVVYFYNPFGRPVMAQVADHLRATFEACPRRIVVVYVGAAYADLWDALPFLQRQPRRSDEPAVWDTRPLT